jgi:SAM-dependent methyltransferase
MPKPPETTGEGACDAHAVSARATSASGIPRLVRAGWLRGWDRFDELTLVGRDGGARTFQGDSAALVRALLEQLSTPQSLDELRARIGALSGTNVEVGGVVDEAVAVLRSGAFIQDASAHPATSGQSAPTRREPPLRVLIGLTGAVAAMYAPVLVDTLLARGCIVKVAATPRALRFVSALALEALTHEPVCSRIWPTTSTTPVPHLALARWAQVMVVYPASASAVSRIARGSCSDVVSAAAIATRAPVLVAPSMNERMLDAPSVARNLDQLRADGFYVVHPAAGIEVAERPGVRRPMRGPAPPASVIADLVHAVAAIAVPIETQTDWDHVYQATPLDELPWYSPAIDDDLARALERLTGPPARFLDLGTGPGTVAIEAARRGFGVVATDISDRALQTAAQRAGSLPIAWVIDDITDTRLRGTFDVVHDRGCLHVLPESRHPAYVEALTRLTSPGSVVLVKAHAPDDETNGDTGRVATVRFTPPELGALLGDAFELVQAERTTFPGPGGRAPAAYLCTLRRR